MRHNLNNLGGVTAFAATTLLLLDLHDLAGSTLWEVFQLTLGIILQLDQVSLIWFTRWLKKVPAQ